MGLLERRHGVHRAPGRGDLGLGLLGRDRLQRRYGGNVRRNFATWSERRRWPGATSIRSTSKRSSACSPSRRAGLHALVLPTISGERSSVVSSGLRVRCPAGTGTERPAHPARRHPGAPRRAGGAGAGDPLLLAGHRDRPLVGQPLPAGDPRLSQDAKVRRWPVESRRALVASLRAPSAPAGPPLASLVAACDPGQLADLAISEGLAGPAHDRLGGLAPAWAGLSTGYRSTAGRRPSPRLPRRAREVRGRARPGQGDLGGAEGPGAGRAQLPGGAPRLRGPRPDGCPWAAAGSAQRPARALGRSSPSRTGHWSSRGPRVS